MPVSWLNYELLVGSHKPDFTQGQVAPSSCRRQVKDDWDLEVNTYPVGTMGAIMLISNIRFLEHELSLPSHIPASATGNRRQLYGVGTRRMMVEGLDKRNIT